MGDFIVLGAEAGEGLAPNSSVGRQSLRAPEGVDQAMLSRDPTGFGELGAEPVTTFSNPSAPEPVEIVANWKPLRLPNPPSGAESVGVLGLTSMAALAAPRPHGKPSPPATPRNDAGQPQLSPDPAPLSDSESDAFSVLGSAEMRGGRMDVRMGRRFRSVRPRLDFVTQLELMELRYPRIVLRVTTDAAGNVIDVQVHRSTGSTKVDQAVKVAMYQWWFEPDHDAAGRPIEGSFLFAIFWR